MSENGAGPSGIGMTFTLGDATVREVPPPFRVLALGAFGATGSSSGVPFALDPDSWRGLPAAMRVQLHLAVPNRLGAVPQELEITATPQTPRDLEPKRLLTGVEPLAELASLVTALAEREPTPGALAPHLATHPRWDVVERALALYRTPAAPAGSPAPTPRAAQEEPGSGSLERIFSLVDARAAADSGVGTGQADADQEDPIGLLTRALLDQLDTLLRTEPMRRVAANWQGLRLLLDATDFRGGGALSVADPGDTDPAEFLAALLAEQAPASRPSLIVTDLVISGTSGELNLLQRLGEVGAAYHTPICCAVAPAFLNLESAWQACRLPLLGSLFAQPAYDGWRALRDKEAARWLVAAFNPVLGREPYRLALGPETAAETWSDDDARPWVSPAWAVAALAAAGAASTGWPTELTLGAGCELAGLPVRPLPGEDAQHTVQIPLAARLDTESLEDLARHGIAALACRPNRDAVFLVRAPLVHTAPHYAEPVHSAAARLRTTLPYQLLVANCAALVAQHLDSWGARPDPREALRRSLEAQLTTTGEGARLTLEAGSGAPEQQLRITARTGAAVMGGIEVVLEVNLPAEQ